jgi:hypothetical protein
MATVNGPWNPQGVILFSQGELSYEFVRHEAFTDHGERVMLARQRSRLGAEGQVVVRCLPPVSVREDFETHARARARLEEEVRLASYLAHPNIARFLARCEVQGVLQELRAGLAAQGVVYGAAEAVAEARRAVSWARQPPPKPSSA